MIVMGISELDDIWVPGKSTLNRNSWGSRRRTIESLANSYGMEPIYLQQGSGRT
jgi:hypothetical protein